MEDQTYQGHKTQCDSALQVKASHGSMGQIFGFWQAREVEPNPCTFSVPPEVPGSPGAEQTSWINRKGSVQPDTSDQL